MGAIGIGYGGMQVIERGLGVVPVPKLSMMAAHALPLRAC